jgi:hypothetical protein
MNNWFYEMRNVTPRGSIGNAMLRNTPIPAHMSVNYLGRPNSDMEDATMLGFDPVPPAMVVEDPDQA